MTIKQHLEQLPEPYNWLALEDDEYQIDHEREWIEANGSIEDWMKEKIAESQRQDSDELGY